MSSFSEKPYHAGTYNVPGSATNVDIFNEMFGSNFIMAEQDRIISLNLMFNTSLAVRINDMANDLIYLRNPSGDQMSVELYDLFPPSTVDIRKVYINNLDASSAVLDIVMLTRVEPGHARN